EEFALALGGRPAVAAHGWDDEGTCACRAKLVENRFDDDRQMSEAAAAHGYRNARAGFQARANLAELRIQRRSQIERLLRRKILPHAEHFWKRLAHGSDGNGLIHFTVVRMTMKGSR